MASLDGCIVPTEPVAALVGSFLADWARERPQTTGQFSSDPNPVTPVRGVAWLAAEAGVPEATITNIAAQRYPTVSLKTADAILSALDSSDLLGREIPIQPNPRATHRARAECCTEDELRAFAFQFGIAGSTFPPAGTSTSGGSLLGVAIPTT